MTTTIPLIVLTNGRPCIHDTVAAARQHLTGWDRLIIVDDSGDQAHRQHLFDTIQPQTFQPVADQAAGYNAAMKEVWRIGRNFPDGIFFLEDDFILETDVDIFQLRDIQHFSSFCPEHLVQVALLRQPWWQNEVDAGGLIPALEKEGHVFEDRRAGGGRRWTQHRAFFTGNPSYIPARTLQRWDWPDGDYSEGALGQRIFAEDPDARSAFLGSRTDGPLVRHVGARSGFGY
jgi:hypothetical protein